jgi:hypothetical protein
MADVTINTTGAGHGDRFNRAPQVVAIDVNTLYCFYIDGSDNLYYEKSTDGGATWGSATTVLSTGTDVVQAWGVWYEPWTNGRTNKYIHIVAGESTSTDSLIYRYLDTASDTLSTQIEVTTWTGANSNPVAQVTVTRGGNIAVGCTWNTSESHFAVSTDSGASFTSKSTTTWFESAYDGWHLLPGNHADNNDVWCWFIDDSASAGDNVTMKTFDDSANSWSESGAVSSLSVSFGGRTDFWPLGATTRHSDNDAFLVCITEYDTATADIVKVSYDGTTFTKTDIITNQAEHACPRIGINQQNDDEYIFYISGSTLLSSVDIHYRLNGGSETTYSEGTSADFRGLSMPLSVDDSGGVFGAGFINDDSPYNLYFNEPNSIAISAAASAGGHAGLINGSLIGVA